METTCNARIVKKNGAGSLVEDIIVGIVGMFCAMNASHVRLKTNIPALPVTLPTKYLYPASNRLACLPTSGLLLLLHVVAVLLLKLFLLMERCEFKVGYIEMWWASSIKAGLAYRQSTALYQYQCVHVMYT